MIMLVMSLLSLTLNHPMMLMVTLLIQTTIIALTLGMMYPSFWLSYMMFLILIGSILILFTYMTSVASNEKFKISYPMLIMSIFLAIMINFSLKMFNNKILLKSEESLMKEISSFNKMFTFPFNSLYMISIIYLLFTLVVVVKLTKPKNNYLNKN
uniref:NADH-ubiquinone oxidoreductase chain 6 n=1 Tax=Platypus contaminatus TaxID=2066526 RepID=A0A6C0RU47_9CUCU|nr:NADH dehydrogenase subunit 6 [Platypus contaminatus]QIA44538.1 NADH dehydrogenase subunit 6 [Platypus contaminatus]